MRSKYSWLFLIFEKSSLRVFFCKEGTLIAALWFYVVKPTTTKKIGINLSFMNTNKAAMVLLHKTIAALIF